MDTEQLAYFALSVLWRSGVEQWRTLNQQTTGVSLGRFEEPIRKYLAGETRHSSGNVVIHLRSALILASRFDIRSVGMERHATSRIFFVGARLWFHIFTAIISPPIVREVVVSTPLARSFSNEIASGKCYTRAVTLWRPPLCLRSYPPKKALWKHGLMSKESASRVDGIPDHEFERYS